MKITLVVHCYFPEHIYGTESYTRALARMLSSSGHSVTIITATFVGEPEQPAFIQEYEWEGVRVIRLDRNRLPNRSVRDTYDMPEIRAPLERILRREQPDVVHVCHLINHTGALLQVLAALDFPVVATFTDFYGICFNNKLQAHDGALCAGPNPDRVNCLSCYLKDAGPSLQPSLLQWAARPALRPLAARAARYASGLLPAPWRAEVNALVERPSHLEGLYRHYRASIAPTRFLQDAYRSSGFAGRMEVSHFGIDIDRSAKPLRRDASVRFGFVGQLAHHKGVHILLEAMARLPQDRCQLDIWGDEQSNPAYAAHLRDRARGLNVDFRGTFPSSDMASRLAEVDVLVIPSLWYENSPLILLNALATHTPVIISDVAGMTEFIAPDISGIAVARGDVGALAVAMRRFCEDRALAGAMSRKVVFERTTRDMADDVIRIYEDVA